MKKPNAHNADKTFLPQDEAHNYTPFRFLPKNNLFKPNMFINLNENEDMVEKQVYLTI